MSGSWQGKPIGSATSPLARRGERGPGTAGKASARPDGRDLQHGHTGHCLECVFTVSTKARTAGRAAKMVDDALKAHAQVEHP